MSLHKKIEVDVLIIGTGLAAVSVALHLPSEMNVLLVSKGKRTETNSMRAQGGIASAYLERDHSSHQADTIQAAKGRTDEETIAFITAAGRQVIQELEAFGVTFDRQATGAYALGQEGAHTIPRIFHSGGDRTGERMMTQLLRQLPHPIIEDTVITELMTVKQQVVGARGYQGETPLLISARAVVLATGGIGGLFTASTNEPCLTGDGLALAAHVGARLSDLGYIQHHPTVLLHDGVSHGLITEALRGAGAYLMTADGRRVMADHPQGDLAARDEVASMITATRCKEPVYLNTTAVERLETRFPTFVEKCEMLNIRPELVEVTTGMHFLMGGIETDQAGRTTVPGLYAVGETASIGLHGKNRLASNSLLECFVMGKELALQLQLPDRRPLPEPTDISGINVMTDPSLTDVLRVNLELTGLEQTLRTYKKQRSEPGRGREAELNRLKHTTARLLLEGAIERLKGEQQDEQMASATTA
ncbi:L-aspartate oxidase [Exiguobacterium antarcticum]|uniref:L-aspartate oxidase n=1 Tax=Exiguobacterium antarcticum TaxID=132920 RepID=UPI000285EC12|nr:FAD-dependent oxidoreductase [Exiguobacterium antarcticum]AFS71055.1 L-aspartate oxidase [Exiguobacterium antarcticum B7]